MAAYLVKTDSEVNEWDQGSEIVFADSEQTARELGEGELGVEPEYLLVARAPEFDGLEGKSAEELRSAMLVAGWWFTCSECECHVYDSYHLDEDDDEIEGDPVLVGDHVYCSQDCREAALERYQSYRENERLVREQAVRQWPGIELVGSNGIEMLDKATVGGADFKFPGGLGTVHWTRTSKTVMVQTRDLDAWALFEAMCRDLQARCTSIKTDIKGPLES